MRNSATQNLPPGLAKAPQFWSLSGMSSLFANKNKVKCLECLLFFAFHKLCQLVKKTIWLKRPFVPLNPPPPSFTYYMQELFFGIFFNKLINPFFFLFVFSFVLESKWANLDLRIFFFFVFKYFFIATNEK